MIGTTTIVCYKMVWWYERELSWHGWKVRKVADHMKRCHGRLWNSPLRNWENRAKKLPLIWISTFFLHHKLDQKRQACSGRVGWRCLHGERDTDGGMWKLSYWFAKIITRDVFVQHRQPQVTLVDLQQPSLAGWLQTTENMICTISHKSASSKSKWGVEFCHSREVSKW